MSMFAIYSAETGVIFQVCTADSVEHAQEICSPDQLAIEVKDGVSDETHFIHDAGVAVLYPPRPDGVTAWDYKTHSWYDPRTLDQLKADKWKSIKVAREGAIYTPKQTSAGLFDADEASQNNLNKVIALTQLAVARGAPAEASYTLATNERVPLTLNQLEQSALEMGAQVQAIYDSASAIRTQIESAQTPADLETISWPTT